MPVPAFVTEGISEAEAKDIATRYTVYINKILGALCAADAQSNITLFSPCGAPHLREGRGAHAAGCWRALCRCQGCCRGIAPHPDLARYDGDATVVK